jgi:hypothetical protein
LWAVANAHLQTGLGETGLEYAIVSVAPWSIQTTYERDPAKRKMQTQRDEVEIGALLFSFDDPLGIDSYTELMLARAGRIWAYKKSAASPYTFTFGLKASLGWAWAESKTPGYKDVSNAIFGGWIHLAFGHDKYGKVYTHDRVVPGFTLGRPDRNPTTREARIRVGYFNKVYRGLTVDVFLEKRSFSFADPVLEDRYTMSKRYGVEIGWQFGGN